MSSVKILALKIVNTLITEKERVHSVLAVFINMVSRFDTAFHKTFQVHLTRVCSINLCEIYTSEIKNTNGGPHDNCNSPLLHYSCILARPNGSVENVKVRRYDNSEGESKVINPVR